MPKLNLEYCSVYRLKKGNTIATKAVSTEEEVELGMSSSSVRRGKKEESEGRGTAAVVGVEVGRARNKCVPALDRKKKSKKLVCVLDNGRKPVAGGEDEAQLFPPEGGERPGILRPASRDPGQSQSRKDFSAGRLIAAAVEVAGDAAV